MKNSIAISILLLIALFTLPGADVTAQREEMHPAPAEAIRKFEPMLGEWHSTATGTVEGNAVTLDYHIAFRKIADGSGLYAEEWFDSKELGKMRGGNMIGFDAGDRKIHWYSVDNMGTTHEHIGDWESPNLFRMRHTGSQEGKTYVEEITTEYTGKNRLQFRLTATLDGRKVQELEGVFARK